MKRPIQTGIVAGVAILAAFFFFATLARATLYAPELQIEVPQAEQNAPLAEVPRGTGPGRLQIPRIKVDAKIQYVGLNAKGNMGVPSNYSDVAWYKYGSLPGHVGSAVIDGHVDNGLGLRGVFKDLEKLKIGDDVYVLNKEGTKVHFQVTDIGRYNYKEVPTKRLFNRGDDAYLNLITCGGTWVKDEKTYNERIVVYTTLVR